MKKLILAASLFFAVAISAQETQPQHNHKERPTVEQQMQEFDGMNLTNKQRSKLEKLFEERDAQMENNRPEPPRNGDDNGNRSMDDRQGPPPPPPSDGNGSGRPPQGNDEMRDGMDKERASFDKKIQKILNDDQYAQYQANHKKHEQMEKDGNGKPPREQSYENNNQ